MRNLLLKFAFLVISLIPYHACFSQVSETDTYKIYADQVRALMVSRGAPVGLIDDALKVYSGSNISSDTDFARLLSQLYPADDSNGFLFYFFNQDKLKIVLLNPGKIIEQKTVAITKEDLAKLMRDVNEKIGLYDLARDRMPTKRGAEVLNSSKPSLLTLDSLIAKATKLLLPDSFDTVYRHLTIIPALNIGAFPFHLLRPYKNDTFLIDRCSFTIAPGIIDLIGKRVKYLKMVTGRSDLEWPKKFEDLRLPTKVSARFTLENALFVSDPVYPVDSAYSFPKLPGAEKEVREATEYAKKYTLLTGKSAVKDSVLTHLNTSDVAYFATHGVASDINPMDNCFIVLGGKSPYLTAREIMNLWDRQKKFPEMIVLSACQTGLGRAMDAGMTGLARSFLLAGSDYVIMSLWNVDDDATAFLMSRFMYHLQSASKHMPSDQLQMAVLDTKKKYPQISKWASFSAGKSLLTFLTCE